MSLSRVLGVACGGIAVVFVIHLAQAAATASVAPSPPIPDSVVIGAVAPTRVAMRHVDFHIAEGLTLHIASLRGEMRGVKHGVVDFDDKLSYVLTVDSGEVALTVDDVTNLLNRYVFAYPGAPLKHLKVSQRAGQLGLTGTLHKGVDIPFDITSTVGMMADNRMRLHPTRIRIFGVDGKALMGALGLNLQKMLDLSKAKGVTVDGNDLILDPLVVLPPPTIRGRIVAVRVERGQLVQLFGPSPQIAATPSPPLSDSAATNYMIYRGGTLHFGKLYMTDADMLVVDEDAADPFDFDNDHYQRQLIAGHSLTMPSLGLEVFMPDARKVPTNIVARTTR